MIPSVLPVALLAGAATAATSCPLSIEITGAEAHVAQVAVKNTGNDPVTVFKANSVLSEHPTRDLLVSDADGNALPFKGVYLNFRGSTLTSDMFQTLQPGETVTTSVNAAKTHRLQGISKASVRAVQAFQYAVGTEAPTSLKDTQSCASVQSSSIDIVPDQSKIADEHVSSKRAEPFFSRILKRDVKYSGCSSSQTSGLQTAVADAVSMSKAAKTAAASQLDYYTTWFISTSVLSTVEAIYQDVADVSSDAPTIYCNDQFDYCDSGALLYTSPSDNAIVPCPNAGFWDLAEFASQCEGDDYDRAGAILHEMTHLFGTGDYAYGPDDAKKLSAAEASENADTYEMYAESVRLGGCTTG